MNTNAVADAVLTVLTAIHSRSYRNKPPQKPTTPYAIFLVDPITPATPGYDMGLAITVHEDPDVSSRAIEDIADRFFEALDDKMIYGSTFNAHVTVGTRQYSPNTELVSKQTITIPCMMRVYFD
jgi:hypothetical protein